MHSPALVRWLQPVLHAAPPARHRGATTFPRPVFNGQSTDNAAPRSQPLVCRFLRSPVPPMRPLGSLLKVEQALLRLLAEDDPVPLSLLHWLVTGTWPPEAMQPCFDVSFPKQSGPGAVPT